MGGQQGDVFPAFTQGGNPDRDDIQAVIQILAEPAVADPLGQGTVGGGNDPHIGPEGGIVPQSFEGAFLEYP